MGGGESMEFETCTFASAAAWDAWLELNGRTAAGVWLRLARKGAEAATLSYAEAVEGALCHGWIDSRKQAESEHFWLQRFTPRSPRSPWSRINKQKAEVLISTGRMRPAGMREVELAKRDGRWAAAYDSPATATVPDDFRQALDANAAARAFFATLDSRNRYAMLFRLQSVRKAETRAAKIARFVAMLANGERIHQ